MSSASFGLSIPPRSVIIQRNILIVNPRFAEVQDGELCKKVAVLEMKSRRNLSWMGWIFLPVIFKFSFLTDFFKKIMFMDYFLHFSSQFLPNLYFSTRSMVWDIYMIFQRRPFPVKVTVSQSKRQNYHKQFRVFKIILKTT